MSKVHHSGRRRAADSARFRAAEPGTGRGGVQPKPTRRRALVALVAGAVSLTLLPPASAVADETVHGSTALPRAGEDFVEIGQLPVLWPEWVEPNFGGDATNGWMILNPGSRRAYQIFESKWGCGNALDPSCGANSALNTDRTDMQSFNLNTLDPVRSGVVTERGTPIRGGVWHHSNTSAPNSSGDVVHAVDPLEKRVFVAITDNAPGVPSHSPDDKGHFSHVAMIDEEAFDEGESDYITEVALPASQRALLDQHQLVGMIFTRAGLPEASEGKLILFFAAPSGLDGGNSQRFANDHYLVQWDVGEAVAQSSVTDWGDWAELLASCGARGTRTPDPSTGYYQTGILRTARPGDHAVYIACFGSPNLNSARVVRVGIDPTTHMARGPLDHTVYPLGRNVSDIVADQAGQRLFLRQRRTGTTWWVFDATVGKFRSAFVGYQESGRAESVGLDPVTGRFYALVADTPESPGGVAYTDGRLNPVPQLTRARQDLAYPGLYAILVDPPTRRVFVRRGKADNESRFIYPGSEKHPAPPELFYRVLEDRAPIATVPPDESGARTVDVDEDPELTSASYQARASGFGTRMLFTGGLDAVSNNAFSSAESTCGSDDREFTFGHVASAELSHVSAAASALGADLSGSTRDDLEDPVARCRRDDMPSTLDGVGGQSFDSDALEAECAEEGEDKKDREVNGQHYVARVECDRGEGRVHGSAGATVSAGPLPVSVDDARSVVSVERLEGGGVHTVVDSIAHGIKISAPDGSRVSIGVVRVEASVVTDGRRGGAETSFVRTMCALETSRFEQSACTRDPEQHQQMAEAITRALGGQGEARVRMPDPELAAGTEAGDQAAIQRRELDRFQDRTINRDQSLAIPGLELVFFQGDDPNRGAGRQIFNFAGAFATNSYTIQCLYGPTADGKACSPPFSFDPGANTTGPAPAPEAGPGFAGPAAQAGGGSGSGEPGYDLVTVGGGAAPAALTRPDDGGGGFVDFLAGAAKKAFRFLFGRSLAEAALLGAVWGLLFLPCYLGERWRLLVRLRADPARPNLAA